MVVFLHLVMVEMGCTNVVDEEEEDDDVVTSASCLETEHACNVVILCIYDNVVQFAIFKFWMC